MADCTGLGDKGVCDKTTINIVFNEPLKDKVMMIKAIDYKRKTTETYLNEGFNVNGQQFTLLPESMIPSPVKYEGLIKVTQSEKYSNLWESDDGIIFERNDFGTFRQTSYKVILSLDEPVNVMERNHSDFSKLKEYAINKAVKEFDSKSIQAILPDSFAYDFSMPNHRELTLQKLVLSGYRDLNLK